MSHACFMKNKLTDQQTETNADSQTENIECRKNLRSAELLKAMTR